MIVATLTSTKCPQNGRMPTRLNLYGIYLLTFPLFSGLRLGQTGREEGTERTEEEKDGGKGRARQTKREREGQTQTKRERERETHTQAKGEGQQYMWT